MTEKTQRANEAFQTTNAATLEKTNGEIPLVKKETNKVTTILLLRMLLLLFATTYVGINSARSLCLSQKSKNPKGKTVDESFICRITSILMTSFGFVDHLTSNTDVCESQEAPFTTEKNQSNKVHLLKKIADVIKKQKNKRKNQNIARKTSIEVYNNAYSTEKSLTLLEQRFISGLSKRAKILIPDLEKRAVAVSWGGLGTSNTVWWQEVGLLRAYGKIMNWPGDMRTNFPFHLCSKGCDAELAIGHTLEFREKFRPWLVSPDVIRENRKGYIYFRGYSPTPRGDNTGHTLVWFRPGYFKAENPVLYFRAILNTLERAVADNLIRSHGKNGKFNVVMDTQGLTFSMLTSFGHVQRAIVMLQDHFPDRLGMIFLANLSKPAEFLFNLVKAVITKEVREKIVILSSDPELRKDVLDVVVMPHFVPNYLGGNDNYEFNTEEYYPRKYVCTNEEAIEYLTTMPYHAA